MKGARELNAMKDTPGFRNKKVLVLTKLRRSRVGGQQVAAAASAGRKVSKVKRKNPLKEKSSASKDLVAKQTRRGIKPKDEAGTSAILPEHATKGDQKVMQHEQSAQSSSKKAPKHSKSSVSKPNRKLRSQVGEILMRHGKKVVKRPKPRRKRTLSGQFDLLDETILKRQLKDSNEPARDIDSPMFIPKKQKRERNKVLRSKVKPDIPKLSTDNICARHELKPKMQKDSVSTSTLPSQEEISTISSVTGLQHRKHTEDGQERLPRKRGRPPKKLKFLSKHKKTSTDITDSETPWKKPRIEEVDSKKPEKREDQVYRGSKQSCEDANPRDPFSFSVVDFEEEDDKEISFKPPGMSGEVKRKPGRPKHGLSHQPPVRSLNVKSTHRLLISDRKSKRFGRQQGKKIAARTSQLYRNSIRKGKRLALKDNFPCLLLEHTDKVDNDAEKKEIEPPCLQLTDFDTSEQSTQMPASPDLEHPILPPIHAICSPSSSNEELEPPVLEMVNVYNVVMEPPASDTDIADVGMSLPTVDNVDDAVCFTIADEKKAAPVLPTADEMMEVVELLPIATEVKEVVKLHPIANEDQEGVKLHPIANEDQEGVELHPIAIEDQEGVELHPIAIEDQEGVELHPIAIEVKEGVDLMPIANEEKEVGKLHTIANEVKEGGKVHPIANEVKEGVELLPIGTQVKEGIDLMPIANEVKEGVELLPIANEMKEGVQVVAPPVKVIDDDELLSTAADVLKKASEVCAVQGELSKNNPIDQSEIDQNTDLLGVCDVDNVTCKDAEQETCVQDVIGSSVNSSQHVAEMPPEQYAINTDVEMCGVTCTSVQNRPTCTVGSVTTATLTTADLEQTNNDGMINVSRLERKVDAEDVMPLEATFSKPENSESGFADNIVMSPEESELEFQSVDSDGQSELNAKDKDNGGIKMKLKRHKGTFKVTGFSREDTDGDGGATACQILEGATEEEVIELLMHSILEKIDRIVDDEEPKGNGTSEGVDIVENETATDDHMKTEHVLDPKDITPVAGFDECYSEGSSPDAEKKVPPLTIRLKPSKPGSTKEDRKFGLRPKFSRSPIEIIALRQKHIDEEYDKNEAARLAKKLEKKLGKKKLCTLSPTKSENSPSSGNIDRLMGQCIPCSVKIVDFVKQLNQSEDDIDANILQDLVDNETEDSVIKECQSPAPAIVKRKRMMKIQKRVQARKQRGRPPKQTKEPLKEHTPRSSMQAQNLSEEKLALMKDVDKLDEVGFVGSFVEFLKANKTEKPRMLKDANCLDPSKCSAHQHDRPSSPVSRNVKVIPVSEYSKTKPQKPGAKYLCNKCDFSSAVRKTMEFHVYSHILGLTFKCGHCNKEFGSMIGASTHSKNEHMGKEQKIIKSKALIETDLYHVLEEEPKVESSEKDGAVHCTSPGQVIISFLVGKSLSLKANLTAKRFVCTHCEYSTDILEDVQQHCEDLHKLDQMFSCILCADAYFKSEEVVKAHAQSTHPSRPQSYRQLPQFYDIEQIKAAEKSHEDRGNIFDRMNTLFTTSSICDDANPRISHYQRARDFLHLQEGWKSKTSAEADSTTTIDNEHVAMDVNSKVPLTDSSLQSLEYVVGGQPGAQDKLTVPDKDYSCGNDLENVKKTETDASSSSLKSVVALTGCGEQPLMNSSVHAVEHARAVDQDPLLSDIDNRSADNEAKCDESSVSDLKIIEVVSLRDQSVDPAYEKSPIQVALANKIAKQKKASKLRNVDLEAVAIRNEKITCTYKCMKCNIHSPYLSAMVEHLKHYHCEIPLFTCPYCKGITSKKPAFTTEISVHEHVKKVHPSNCAKNEVSLSDTAKTLVQVLAIPSGVDSSKVGNTYVIEKDIYMCLKCKTHMPSLDYTFSHLEKEHIDVFVNVCPICKVYQDKSEDQVCLHIIKEHKQDPSAHTLSVAIEDSLFVRVPSISKSGTYSDRASSRKKAGSNPNATATASQNETNNDDDDILVIGETYEKSVNLQPSIKQAVGKTPQASGNPHHLSLFHKKYATVGASAKPQVVATIKQSSDQSHQLLLDCESVEGPLNASAEIVEEDVDVSLPPAVPAASNPGCIVPAIDASTVISHSAAVAVASSIMSTNTSAKIPSPSERTPSSLPLTNKKVWNTPVPSQEKLSVKTHSGRSESRSGISGEEDTPSPSPSPQQMAKSVESGKQQICQAIKEIQTKPKSSMTDTIHKLQIIAEEKERARLSKDKSSPVSAVENIQTVSRPVLKVPIYTASVTKASQQQQQLTQVPPVAKDQHRSPVVPVQHRSLLFRNTPLDLSRTPSPATRPPQPSPRAPTLVTPPQLAPQETITAASPAALPTDELPPDAFKIFNLKPEAHRNVKSSTTGPIPSKPLISNTMTNFVGQLSSPGGMLQGHSLPFTQILPVQMAGVPLTPLQLQSLCVPGVNSTNFIVTNFQQQQQQMHQQQQQQQHDKRTNVTQQQHAGQIPILTHSPDALSKSHMSTAKTVAQALAERARQQQQQHRQQQQQQQQRQQHMQQLRQLQPKHHQQHLAQQRNRMKQSKRMQLTPTPAPTTPTMATYYCPYCPEYRPLPDFQVTPHIQRCHPGREVIFMKHSS